MNYIELINRFWELDEAWQFSCCETRLYFYLVKTANRLGWENNWTHSDDKTSANVGVSKNTLKTARNKLSQAGLISFKEGGKGHANKTRYQILTPNPIPKVTPNLIPNIDPNLDPLLNKHKPNQTDIPPIPLVGGEKVTPEKREDKPGWKNDYEVYLEGLRAEYRKAVADSEWISKQEKFNPGVDIPKSIEKACVNYWATEAGWVKKKRSRIKEIDWRSTFANAVSQKTNRVYKNDLFRNSTADKYEQKRNDSEQRKLDSLSAIDRMREEAANRRKELEAEGIIGALPGSSQVPG